MRKRKSTKKRIPYILRQISKNTRLVAQKLIRRSLRTLGGRKRRPGFARAGFVLPTVTMVMLVVILLSIAISLRSFDRAQDARNVRVNQAVLSAAAPALDRAKAKLEELLVDNPPTTDTPNDDALLVELTNLVEIEDGGTTSRIDKYTFGDEQRLQVSYKIQGTTIDEYGEDNDENTIEDNEITTTAWRFPVDTDNDDLYDSFTVYGIFFRTPERENDGSFKWARTPLDARTPPMDGGTASTGSECAAIAGTSSSLVGDSGWYQSEGKLKKSFFVYTVTVPITDLSVVTGNYDSSNFETFNGSTGYSALEYQQDWTRIPLTNNAVVYEDDLEIAPGPEFRLNGRIQANSNLIISSTSSNNIELHLVSSKNSCFYEDEENSKIIVGGNVINGLVERDDFSDKNYVHLQQGNTVIEGTSTDIQIGQTHESVDNFSSSDVSLTNVAKASAYNTDAYNRRINWLVEAQIDAYPDTDSPGDSGYGFAEEDDDLTDGAEADPLEVIQAIDESTNKPQARINALATYFKQQVRKVPFAEVAEGDVEPTPTVAIITGTGDNLRVAIDEWTLPTGGNISQGTTDAASSPTNLDLFPEELEATNPTIVDANDGKQFHLGDRVLVGNNLPQKVWDDSSSALVSEFQQEIDDTTTWLDETGDDSGVLRYRQPRVATIADVGSTSRDGFWEDAAATEPEAALDGIGGLRVITGAGVYERTNSFLPPPPTNPDGFPVVWPDTMPMSPESGLKVYNNDPAELKWDDLPDWPLDTTNSPAISDSIDPNTPQYAKGDLRMRATAVYHYANDFINDTDDSLQAPIACIASYYDPSTRATAAASDANTNGIVYGPPGARPDAAAYDSSTELFSGSDLADQANMVFPDGRFVNEKLRDALQKEDADRSLSEQAAIDTTMCALGILDGSLTRDASIIPDDAIKEVAFLDARQIKASDPDNTTTTEIDEAFAIFDLDGDVTVEDAALTNDSNLSLEERQPLEIRATQIDLGVLRQTAFAPTTSVGPRRDSNEYLLPLSGIIYASRDDAQPDRSDTDSISNDDLANSAFDLKLDPTRRPNGIMLINGERLDRPAPTTMTSEEVTKEKGLTLVSNLPVYIQGDFNLHQNASQTEIEEFDNLLDDDWSDFYTRNDFDDNFACRAGDPRLSACTNGDYWRAANILSDSITLLSDNWRPGFRNEGDFDLRNNGGNGIIGSEANPTTIRQKRLFNGFFANSYATNGLSSNLDLGTGTAYTDANYSSNTDANNSGSLNSSYFNNFVTPVQRRINGFPEYVMEVCPKLPVYACEPDDWVVDVTGNLRLYDLLINDANGFIDGSSNNYFNTNGFLRDNFNLATEVLDTGISASTLESGTTVTTPATLQRFPRRVAFLRNKYGTLEMDEDRRPIPIGVDNSGNIRAYPYDSTAANPLPRTDQNNALWFRTTNNAASPTTLTGATYTATNPLFYLAYNETPNTGNKPILPPTPAINGVSLTDDVSEDDAYRYSFCIADTGGVGSREYYAINSEKSMTITPGSGCPDVARTKIQDLRQALMALDASLDNTTGGNPTIKNGANTLAGDANEDGMVVYEIPSGTIAAGTTYTLEGDSNDIFVLKTPASTAMTFNGSSGGVKLELSGVEPNNIFWVSDAGMTINNATSANPHILAGNFIGKYDGGTNYPLAVGQYTKIIGGRFLGFKGGAALLATVKTGQDIRAMTNQANVSVVPVLQIHEPDATAAAPGINGGNAAENTAWMQRAEETTFNLVAATGDTPSRPGQSNGGLQNLVRFQENWEKPTKSAVNISGAFIQLERSQYATAPQQQLLREDIDANVTSDLFGYPQKYSGAADGILGFQAPPDRKWGFDVGLLSQSPDLFAQKFSQPSSDNKPNEYFREVGRDDAWVQGLLCAKTDETTPTNAVNRPSGLDCSKYE